MRARQWAAMAASLAFCVACVSKHAPKRVADEAPIGSIAWSEMVGLTQDQIRAQLGLKRSGETFATQGVRLDVGRVIAETTVRDLARAPCRHEPKGMVARVAFSHQAAMTFVNGRLTAVNGLEPGDPPMTIDHPLRAACRLVASPKQDTPPVKRSTTDKVVAAVKWGMMAPDRTEVEQRNFERWQVIGNLHLGGTPPGGVEAWAKLHADAASDAGDVAARGDVRINIRTGGRIVLRNGLVAAIEPEDPDASCLLRSDMSLACDQKRYY
jgi:hypothetical protein